MSELQLKRLILDHVLIKPDILPEDSGGIILTDEQSKKVNTGTVIAVGKGKQAEDTGVWVEMQIAEGDRVYFERSASVPYMDTEYLLISQPYIKSII